MLTHNTNNNHYYQASDLHGLDAVLAESGHARVEQREARRVARAVLPGDNSTQVERFEPTAPQSAVPSHPLTDGWRQEAPSQSESAGHA